MHPVLFQLGPVEVYSFGFMVAVAILTAAEITRRELDRLYAAGRLPAVLLPAPDKKGKTKLQPQSPSGLIWTVMLLAAGFGIAGSKLFHLIDYPEQFLRDPLGSIFSAAGLTFYGGLITAALAIGIYVKRKGVPVLPFMDAIAPSLILGYGIGRIGCYLAGDGDWGMCSDLAAKPAWIPAFLWSETFPNNILGVDVLTWERGRCLLPPGVADGVYPTMLYEFILCTALFGVLWALRKHAFQPGWLFFLYMIFNGAERILIETIRINPATTFGLPQSQFIGSLLIVSGIVGMIVQMRKRPSPPVQA